MISRSDRLHRKLARLQEDFSVSGLLCNGTVLAVKKFRQHSKTPRIVYQWTRKVQNRTLTVALTKTQYEAFKTAIANQRRLHETIREMQELSAEILQCESEPAIKIHPKRA